VLTGLKPRPQWALFDNLRKWAALAEYCRQHGYGMFIGDCHRALQRALATSPPEAFTHDLLAMADRGSAGWGSCRRLLAGHGATSSDLTAVVLGHGLELRVDPFVLRRLWGPAGGGSWVAAGWPARQRRPGAPWPPGSGLPNADSGEEWTRLRRVLLRWQAPQRCPAHRATGLTRPSSGGDRTAIPTAFPAPQMAYPLTAWRLDHCCSCPLGGVVRPGRKVRFARLIHRPGRVLAGPAVRAASGGSLSLPRLLLAVVSRLGGGPYRW
jgi:hypothetical protein